MKDVLRKIRLIWWKNIIIDWRNKKSVLLQILCPILMTYFFLLLNNLMSKFVEEKYVNETQYHEIQYLNESQNSIVHLYYVPKLNTTNQLIEDALQYNNFVYKEVRGFYSEDIMMSYISFLSKNQTEIQDILAVVFDDFPQNGLPKKLKYRIRTRMKMNVENLFSEYPQFRTSENMEYYYSKFLNLQQAIDKAFIHLQSNKNVNYELVIQQMPFPPHWEKNFENFLLSSIPYVLIAFITICFIKTLRKLLQEKSSGMKEFLKIHNLNAWILWLGWYLNSMFYLLIIQSVITILFKVPLSKETSSFLEFSNGFIVWLFLILYCSSSILFFFMISIFFNKPTMGVNLGSVIWFVTLLLAASINSVKNIRVLGFFANLILLLPNASLLLGFFTITELENQKIGCHWYNLFDKSNNSAFSQSIGAVLLLLILQSIIFAFLTWYFDNIRPGNYGVARKWNYIFKKSFWCKSEEVIISVTDFVDGRDEVEAPAGNLNPNIRIRNLCKQFKEKMAVNKLNMDIYNNEITVLLGHNGAGKTTTMNIITGLLPANSGIVTIDGYDLQNNLFEARKSVGFCPQHNVHFDDLTVREHLEFFAQLRGMSKTEAGVDCNQQLTRLDLKDKEYSFASSLSGGQLRRLSLAMALTGGARVLLLDEPSSGLDPEARRHVWDILLSVREQRTILITTHHMEEADILGDRIAIMHSGQLHCYGSQLFLKNFYAAGYTLSILVDSNYNIDTITNTIKNFVANSTLKGTNVGSIKYDLLTNDTKLLSQLFLHLEQNKSQLNILNFGVFANTMEEVFLKVGKLAEEKEISEENQSKTNTTNSSTNLLIGNFTEEPIQHFNSGYALVCQQFTALLVKRFQYILRNKILFLTTLLCPIAFLILSLWTELQTGTIKDVSRNLFLSDYKDANSFYFVDKDIKMLADYYSRSVQDQNSIATNVPQVSEAILNFGIEEPLKYHSTLITAAELNSSNNNLIFNAMYGNWALHGPAISINLINNAVLKYFMADDSYSIDVSNNPIPAYYNSEEDGFSSWMSTYPFGLTFSFGMLLGIYIHERKTGVKHLQIMTGLRRYLYWLNNYIFDIFLFLFILTISVVIMLIFNTSMANINVLDGFVLMMLCFILAMLPFNYFLHYLSEVENAINLLVILVLIFAWALQIIILALEMSKLYKELTSALLYISSLFPLFLLSRGLYKLDMHAAKIKDWINLSDNEKNLTCFSAPEAYPCCDPDSKACSDFYNCFTGNNSITPTLIWLIAEAFVYSIVFLMVDYGLLRKLSDKIMYKIYTKIRPMIEEENLDSDVVVERQRITNEDTSNDTAHRNILRVMNLRRWFKNLYAVRDLNFGVKPGECFGLLGVNGAGKTTTFKMLTNEIFPSTGTANILDFYLNYQRTQYLKCIGYCPQINAFNHKLSPEEMLTLFAHLRGIPKDKLKNEVNKWLNKLDLLPYVNVPCGKLSGGNMRKLNTAIALISNPPLIMLDEPTSGVDPIARRKIWSILATICKTGQAIVLTSHSMDECEALCDRLAIMVDGQFRCIGDIPYLKNKFAQGYSLSVKLRYIRDPSDGEGETFENKVRNLKLQIENKFTCVLKDEHVGMILYHVTDRRVKLAEIFSSMEALKQSMIIIEDYSVSDTSLEQIFLSFAKDKYYNDEYTAINII